MSKQNNDQLSFPFGEDRDKKADNDLPEGWIQTVFRDLGDWTGGGTPSKQQARYWKDGNIPWVSPKDMKVLWIETPEDYITPLAVEESSTKLIPAGSLLFVTRSGILRHSLPVGITKVDVAINQDLKALVLSSHLEPSYVLYYVLAYSKQILRDCVKQGTTVQSIQSEKLFNYPVLLAPLAEQKRIIAQVDLLLAEVHRTQERLERAKEILVQLRHAVLDAACSGRLTEDWRAENPNVETADVLLERLFEERRKKWEVELLSKYEKQGKKPAKGWKERYKEPKKADGTVVQELPETWNIVSSDAIFHFVTSGSRGWAKYYTSSGAQFIRVGNLLHTSISLDLSDIQHIQPPDGAEKERTRIRPKDLLISVTAEVGMIALVPDDIEESYVNQHVAITRPLDSIHSSFLGWYLAAPRGGQTQFKEKQYGVTKAGLNLDDIKSLSVPLPPFAEQKEIVRRIENLFDISDDLEEKVGFVLERSKKMSESIIAKAFRGEIVPTEAELARLEKRDYEPASELLEKIKTEQAGKTQESSKRKKPTVAKKKTAKTRRSLYDVLIEAGTRLTSEDLFAQAGFMHETVEAFYDELRAAVDTNQIREIKTIDADVYLEAAPK